MKKQTGTTFMEVIIVLVIMVVIGGVIASSCVNNRGATETRAKEGATLYIQNNELDVKRFSCAGDSDHDGYGTCNIVLKDGEKIIINCPTNWSDVNIWGATGCKEVIRNYQIQGASPINMGND